MKNSNKELNSTIKPDFSKYKSVIAEIMKISYRTEHQAILTDKLRKYAFKLSEKLISNSLTVGHTEYSVVAKINEHGYEYINPEIPDNFRIIAIDDEYGAVADELLSFIKNEAVSRHIDIICCYNPFLQYSLERIIFTNQKIALCKSSWLCKIENAERTIHAKRFLDESIIAKHIQILRFNKKIITELLNSLNTL